MGLPPALPPFVRRISYRPLIRPKAKGEQPEFTLGLDYEATMLRIAQHLHCPLWVVGAMPIADYLDEADAHRFLADTDDPPRREDDR